MNHLSAALHALVRNARIREFLDRALPVDAGGYLPVLDGLEALGRADLVESLFALEAVDPKLYRRALAILREHREVAAVPLALVLLESPDLGTRERARTLLRETTRRNFGFDPKASTGERRAALVQWQKWWRSASRGFGGDD